MRRFSVRSFHIALIATSALASTSLAGMTAAAECGWGSGGGGGSESPAARALLAGATPHTYKRPSRAGAETGGTATLRQRELADSALRPRVDTTNVGPAIARIDLLVDVRGCTQSSISDARPADAAIDSKQTISPARFTLPEKSTAPGGAGGHVESILATSEQPARVLGSGMLTSDRTRFDLAAATPIPSIDSGGSGGESLLSVLFRKGGPTGAVGLAGFAGFAMIRRARSMLA